MFKVQSLKRHTNVVHLVLIPWQLELATKISSIIKVQSEIRNAANYVLSPCKLQTTNFLFPLFKYLSYSNFPVKKCLRIRVPL